MTNIKEENEICCNENATETLRNRDFLYFFILGQCIKAPFLEESQATPAFR